MKKVVLVLAVVSVLFNLSMGCFWLKTQTELQKQLQLLQDIAPVAKVWRQLFNEALQDSEQNGDNPCYLCHIQEQP